MKTNREWYKEDLAVRSEEYNITINEFKDWLSSENRKDTFDKMLNDDSYDNYDIAVDYSIFIIMVKYFRKTQRA